jgi:hypothetical protein
VPAPAYSKVLWELEPPYAASADVFAPAVPDGYVWVLREISAYLPSSSGITGGAYNLAVWVSGIPVWQTPFNGTLANKYYELRDCRIVVESTDSLYINVVQPYWLLRVSGYQFTA